jgi:LacI family transcriptional regulator
LTATGRAWSGPASPSTRRSSATAEDLSVVGFDELPVARWASPPMTTVRQPLAEMGRAAAQMLGELIDGLPLRSSRMELTTELIVRESTAAPDPAPPRE